MQLYDRCGSPRKFDMYLSSAELLDKLERGYPFSFKGLKTSILDLAQYGYGLRVTKSLPASQLTRCTFFLGRDNLTFRLRNFEWKGDYDDLFDTISRTTYRGSSSIGLSVTNPALAFPPAFSVENFSEADLLQELERRVDLKPKRKKVKRKISNVVDITEKLRIFREKHGFPAAMLQTGYA